MSSTLKIVVQQTCLTKPNLLEIQSQQSVHAVSKDAKKLDGHFARV